MKAEPNSFSWFAVGALRLSESSAFPLAAAEAHSFLLVSQVLGFTSSPIASSAKAQGRSAIKNQSARCWRFAPLEESAPQWRSAPQCCAWQSEGCFAASGEEFRFKKSWLLGSNAEAKFSFRGGKLSQVGWK